MNVIRKERIKEFIEENNVVTIKQLQALFPEISLMTIHRDLDSLEQEGTIVKVRGGAKLVHHPGDPGFDVRLQENNAGKKEIVRKALSLIQPNSTIFLDASTTNLMLARSLPDIDLNIFTTGPNIAIELCRLQNPVINLCCGRINRKNMALSGQITLDMLDRINIDVAFIGVSGCSADSGFTCGTESDMVVKRKVIQKARTSVVLCDRVKFSRLMPYTFAQYKDVDYLISDDRIPQAVLEAARQENVQIL